MRRGCGDVCPGLAELKPDASDSDAMHKDHNDQKHGAYKNLQNWIRVGEMVQSFASSVFSLRWDASCSVPRPNPARAWILP